MKKVLVAFVVLFVLVAGGATAFIVTFNPNQYRPLIVEKASEALGTPVDLGGISLGWRRGLAMRLRDVVVYADPGKSSAAAKLKEASATLQIMPLLNKELHISSIVLFDPQAHLVKTQDGKVGLKGVKLPSGGSAEKSAASASGPAVPVDLGAFSIHLFQVRNGAVWFEDVSSTRPLSVMVKDIDVDVEDFSLIDEFSFRARASLFSSLQNLQAEGVVTLPVAGQAGILEDGVFRTDLAQLDLSQLTKTFAAVRSAGVQEIKGVLETKLDRLDLGGAGRADAALSLEGGRVRLASFKSPLDDLMFKGAVAGDDLRIQNFSAKFAGGTLKANGIVKKFRTQALSGLSWSSKDLAIDQMMPDASSGPRLSGRMSLDFEGQSAGMAWQQISQTLAGQGQFSLRDGVLLNYNLLRTVVQKLSMVPGAEEALRNHLPNIYKAKMNEPSTLLQPIQVPFVIQNGQVYFSRMDLVTDFIIIQGSGQVGLDKRVAMKTSVRLHQGLTQAIVSLVPQAQMVVNSRGEIEMPGQLQGVLPHVMFVPDTDFIAQKLLTSEAAQKLIKGFVENPEGSLLQARNLLDKPLAAGESGVKNSVAGLLDSEDGLKNLFQQALGGDSGQTAGSGAGTQNQ